MFDTTGYAVRVIETRDMPPEKFFARLPTVTVIKLDEFLSLSTNPGYNSSPGSCFVDSRKAYFFGPKLCFMHQIVGESNWATKSRS